MSAGLIPCALRAATSLFMAVLFAAIAEVAVLPVVVTPKVNSAWVGTALTMPVPSTVIVFACDVASALAVMSAAIATVRARTQMRLTGFTPYLRHRMQLSSHEHRK